MHLFGIDGTTFVLFISAAAVLLVTPGPAVLYIVAAASTEAGKTEFFRYWGSTLVR